MTAAITVSSKPRPAVGWPAFISEHRIRPATPTSSAGDDEGEELQSLRPRTPESRTAFGIGADKRRDSGRAVVKRRVTAATAKMAAAISTGSGMGPA